MSAKYAFKSKQTLWIRTDILAEINFNSTLVHLESSVVKNHYFEKSLLYKTEIEFTFILFIFSFPFSFPVFR